MKDVRIREQDVGLARSAQESWGISRKTESKAVVRDPDSQEAVSDSCGLAAGNPTELSLLLYMSNEWQHIGPAGFLVAMTD
jgi:hypothetical protein